ncbi:hypothetical protein BC793_101246 [Actinoplanes xinjiangensis]|uniref:Uncharacterized protein n=1 Tax=Actinoplanes xinjiangensis TaxID=512350 RepID=A0A316GCF1_9ACTN|nr:hypothetical protein BC793_101246 [Actinoplanes xinjiangensis]
MFGLVAGSRLGRGAGVRRRWQRCVPAEVGLSARVAHQAGVALPARVAHQAGVVLPAGVALQPGVALRTVAIVGLVTHRAVGALGTRNGDLRTPGDHMVVAADRPGLPDVLVASRPASAGWPDRPEVVVLPHFTRAGTFTAGTCRSPPVVAVAGAAGLLPVFVGAQLDGAADGGTVVLGFDAAVVVPHLVGADLHRPVGAAPAFVARIPAVVAGHHRITAIATRTGRRAKIVTRATAIVTRAAQVTALVPRITKVATRVKNVTAGITDVTPGITDVTAGVADVSPRVEGTTARVQGATARIQGATAPVAAVTDTTGIAHITAGLTGIPDVTTGVARIAEITERVARVDAGLTGIPQPARIPRVATITRFPDITGVGRLTQVTGIAAGTRIADTAGVGGLEQFASITDTAGLTEVARVAGIARVTGLMQPAGIAQLTAGITPGTAPIAVVPAPVHLIAPCGPGVAALVPSTVAAPEVVDPPVAAVAAVPALITASRGLVPVAG